MMNPEYKGKSSASCWVLVLILTESVMLDVGFKPVLKNSSNGWGLEDKSQISGVTLQQSFLASGVKSFRNQDSVVLFFG